jgi:outer membrane protein TolC
MIRQQYGEGAALATQVLDAEQTLRVARARHARALADYAIAGAALQQSIGTTW